ncbi:transporter substrate-binding domain-containing protein [Chromobacterium sp.]|uniref:transporter substrate-binding domain-containing protein n=1 Tax=Chromobacterium sp. TaxID=306190 RepID=UPI0035AF30F1
MPALVIAILICLGMLGWPPAASAASVVKIASDDWCPYICADQSRIIGGYLVELTDQALNSQGYQVEAIFLPLNRAMKMTEEGVIDGIYAPALDQRLLLSKPMAYSRACFYTLKDSNWRYHGLPSLAHQSLGLIADYGYDGGAFDDWLLTAKAQGFHIESNIGQTAGSTNIKKLLLKRYSILLEHETVMNHLIAVMRVDGSLRKAGCLEQALTIVIGVGRSNPNAHALVRAINTGLETIRASGQLDGLKTKYKISTE